MTFRDLEDTVDRLEHALADLSPDVREPIDLIASELVRMAVKLMVDNDNLYRFVGELKESVHSSSALAMGEPSRN